MNTQSSCVSADMVGTYSSGLLAYQFPADHCGLWFLKAKAVIEQAKVVEKCTSALRVFRRETAGAKSGHIAFIPRLQMGNDKNPIAPIT